MRAGPNWAAHQTLTAEAATVLRHSLSLARQRRHAQLTPLHVAVALLTTRPSVLLKCCHASSQPPHTLQNRALELCFSVALNRLPTTPTVHFLSAHNVSLSNALVAAMKRAQASQRRGCGELQNSQQFMGVMVGLEQLIISILDDPSVSRVMRDAGLSSTAVKGHIEEHFSSVSFHGGLGSRIHEARNAHHLMETITKPLNQVKGGDGLFNCCVDCTANYEKEAELLKSRRQLKGVLPIRLQHQSQIALTTKGDELAELRRKWSSLCQSLHRHYHYASKNTCKAPSSYPWWPTQKPIINPGVTFGAVKLNHGDGGGKKCNFMAEQLPNLDFLKNGGGKDERINLTLGNNYVSGLRRVLQENVPWQSEKIGPIVEALMNPRNSKKDIWLMIDGDDAIGKKRLVSAIAESLHRSIAHFNMKEARADAENLFDEMLNRGFADENILVLVENVDLANTRFIRRLSDRFDNEEKEDNGGKLIFVLTKGDSNCNEEANSVIQLQLQVIEAINHQKPTLDFPFPIKIKRPRIDEKEDPILGTVENLSPTKKRKDCFFFDLNVEAEEYPDGSSSTSSELTRDEQTDPFLFLESIGNQLTFNRSLTRDREMADFFSSKLKESFDLVFGDQNKKIEFSIDDALLPKISAVSGFVTNCLLGKWLEEIFQTSLNMVKISGKSVGEIVRLCSGGESLDERFMRSCLPKKINIQFEK